MDYCYPLTYAQNRLWFEYKLNPSSIKYNLPFLFKIKGNLNAERLKKSWDKIVQKHANRRTYFQEKDYIPYQCILSSFSDDLKFFDLSELDLKRREIFAQDIVGSEINRNINILPFSLYNLLIIKINENKYYLLFDFHRIIIDAHSVSVLLNDFSDEYNHQSLKNGSLIHAH